MLIGLVDVILFILQVLFCGANFFGPMEQGTDHTVLCRYFMMAIPLEVLIGMDGFYQADQRSYIH